LTKTRTWASLAGAAAIGMLLFLDIGVTVPLKAAVLGLLPVESLTRVSVINGLCLRAYVGDRTAATDCYYAYVSKSDRDEAATQRRAVAAKRSMCARVDAAFKNGPPKGVTQIERGVFSIIANTEYDEPYLNEMSMSGYTVIVDRNKGTITGADFQNLDTYFEVDCKEF